MADVNDLPSNSHASREEAEVPAETGDEIQAVGGAKKRKKPLGRRFLETFTGSDAHSVKSYIFEDVIVPAIKNLIVDTITQGAERMINGDSTSRRGNGRQQFGSGGPMTSYNRMSERRPERREMSQRGREIHDFDEIVFESRGEAEQALLILQGRVAQYGNATVANLYAAGGVSSGFTDEKYGWFDLRGASISRVSGGYLLNLPKPEPIDS